jgi:hypothetical protein
MRLIILNFVRNTEAKPAAVIAAQYRNCAQAVAWGSSFEARRTVAPCRKIAHVDPTTGRQTVGGQDNAIFEQISHTRSHRLADVQCRRVLDYFLRAPPELSVKIRMIVRIHAPLER